MGKRSKAKVSVSSALAAGGGSGRKCTRCLATVKTEAGKGKYCPGCSELYCWRCEKKSFSACPNGAQCVCPKRVCRGCISGQTMEAVLSAAGQMSQAPIRKLNDGTISCHPDSIERFMKFIEQSDKLSFDAIPFKPCGNYECKAYECYSCFTSQTAGRLVRCTRCNKVTCANCSRSVFEQPLSPCFRINNWSDRVEAFADMLVNPEQGGMALARCSNCHNVLCYDCVGASMLCRYLKSHTVDKVDLQCERCYYSAKPCMNPTCPNKVGVPTKRCGVCRRSRYCSKECQIAAYPGHQHKCKKIQEKLAGCQAKGEQ